MKIGSREIGGGAPCLVVAEVGMAHDGSLGMAHAYIDAVATAGAEAVKFQRHDPEEGGEWRVKPEWSRDRTRADYWQRTGFSEPEWYGLAVHAEDSGLLFLCSTFTPEGAQSMEPLLPAWKVASGQVTNGPMLDYMAAHPKPTIISEGMANSEEFTDALYRFREVVALVCTSIYPTPLDRVGLIRGMYAEFEQEEGQCWLRGLSDHSGTIWPSLAAATLGATMVEVHVTFSRDAYGPDASSSITLDELRLLCEGIRAIRECQKPVDREALLRGPLAEARRVYMAGVSA